jgi:arginine repressor
MTQRLYGGIGYLLFSLIALAAQDVVSVLDGTVKKVDSGTKTVVVKTADGAEHTFHFLGRTVVRGTEATAKGSKDAFHGLKEGSEVAVHYTAKGGRETADEVDRIGKDGLKMTEGTVSHIDRGAKTIVVKTADGTEETYRLADRAVKDTGKDIGEGTEKSAKVTVYYTEEGGHKVAPFFKKIF